MAYLGTRRRPALGPVQRNYTRLNYASPLIQGMFLAVPDFASAIDSGRVINVASPGNNLDYADIAPAIFWHRRYFSYRGMPLVGGYSEDANTRFTMESTIEAFIQATNKVTLSMIVLIIQTDPDGSNCPWDLRDGAGFAQHYPYIDNTIQVGTFAIQRWSSSFPFPPELIGVPHMVTITFENGSQQMFIGERLVGTGSTASNPGLNFANGYDGFGGSLPSSPTQNNSIGSVWMWNRILTQGEIAYHVDNPWDTFEAAQRRRYYIAGAASSALLGSSTFSFIPTATMVGTAPAAGDVLRVITTGMRW